ncbi:hypothetical protein OBP_173 [Pseudomonas phage OBP]|uniref:hypothetical protein n=1 Tax=Pseudomonas phage OBP TaxID=1124849 RepID=UPI000240D58D|nr:hypothetical protein OBP_173 [Pseudomonas phage OBP]AEV89610.1 hypothetical protein OBP_173 [Pseudomonas phage OBP]
MSKYPSIEAALVDGPGSMTGSINEAFSVGVMREIGDSIDGGLTSWLNEVGVPRRFHFAFKVKRLKSLMVDDVSTHSFLSLLKETFKLQYGDWISLIHIDPPEKYNSSHLQKFLMFTVYSALLEDLKDHHAAFKSTLVYLDDIEHHVNLFNRVLSNLPDATIIDEVIISQEVVRRAARTLIDKGVMQLTWDTIEYRQGIILS